MSILLLLEEYPCPIVCHYVTFLKNFSKDGVWVGHLLSGYSLPMEVPPQGNGKSSGEVGGMWKHSIKVSYEATKAAFPGGEVIAHLDQK